MRSNRTTKRPYSSTLNHAEHFKSTARGSHKLGPPYWPPVDSAHPERKGMEMIDYVVTEQGRDFLIQALQECTRSQVSWFQLWSPSATEAQLARARLNLLDANDYSEDTARILGVYAVMETLQSVAAGHQDVSKATRLLGQAGLLTNDIVEPAAALLNLSGEELWGVFAQSV